VGVPLLVAAVYVGGYVLWLSVLIVSLVGMYEIYTAMSKKLLPVHFLGFAYAVLYFLLINKFSSSTVLLVLNSMFLVCVLVMLVFMHQAINIIDCAVALFGYYYVPVLLSFIYLVREHTYGAVFVWFIFICAFGSDTFALIIGMLFGRHRMTETPSPRKTWEGAVGGAVGVAALSCLYGFLVSRYIIPPDELKLIVRSVVVGVFGSVFAQLGDLAASAIKRHTGIKDVATILPGHGGILDRFDSVLFTAPTVYFVMYFMIDYLRGV
jgi:phosphatidate cytidylyltransferase